MLRYNFPQAILQSLAEAVHRADDDIDPGKHVLNPDAADNDQ